MRPIEHSAKVILRLPRAAVWDYLSDTDRMNRGVGLPPVRFLPDPGLRPKMKRAESVLLGIKLAYEEHPFEWVVGRYYQVARDFPDGPIAHYEGGVRLKDVEGGTEVEAFATIVPRNLLGSALALGMGGRIVRVGMLAFARDFERRTAALKPGERSLPPPGQKVGLPQLETGLVRLMGYPVSESLREKLRWHLFSCSETEAGRMRPFSLADRWEEGRLETLRALLYAVKAGLLDLSWNPICPECRAPAEPAASLSKLRPQVHCGTCQVRFDSDFASSVEVWFQASLGIRPGREKTFCISGPANSPQITTQLRLAPGERRVEWLELAPGIMRVHCFEAGPSLSLPASPDPVRAGKLAVRLVSGKLGVDASQLRAGVVRLEAENGLDREALLTIEQESWRESAATAAMVMTLEEFVEQFPEEAITPGQEIGISTLAVMFTDMRQSTALYYRIGDPKAFSHVQDHFRYLTDHVSLFGGGLVKTMGDAIMAVFPTSAAAASSALAMQLDWPAFLQSRGLPGDQALKIGLHRGPAIAVNNRGRQDYFGTTVNISAKIQKLCRGNDIVMTKSLYEDAEVQASLARSGWRTELLESPIPGLPGMHSLYWVRRTG